MKTTASLMIGVPCERTVLYDAFGMFLRIAQRNLPMIIGNCSIISLARDSITAAFLNSQHTHLLMLDSDMLHPADIHERLSRWLTHPGKPQIIGGLNFKRGHPFSPCAFMRVDGSLLPLTQWPPGLIRVDAIGTGSILVAREVFEAIGQPWWPFSYDGPALVGEDLTFCKRAYEAGFEVWCDTTTTSPHLTQFTVSEPQFREWMAHNTPAGPAMQVKSELIQSQETEISHVKS